jgi:RND superfamily putative drug exporter
LGAWLVVAAVLGPLQPKLQGATQNDASSFLPKGSGSTKTLELLDSKFPEGRDVPAIVVFGREGGLTRADAVAIGRIAARLARPGELRDAVPPAVPSISGKAAAVAAAKASGLVAPNGDAVLVPIEIDSPDSHSDVLEDDVDNIRSVLKQELPPGLQGHVTGPAGVTVDTTKAFSAVGSDLLGATVLLVLVLLILMYRAPLIALVPLVVVGFAYAIAGGLVYLLVDSGVYEVNSQTTGILIVLMFGAGTDYSLLTVHRYKEQLLEHEDRFEAMRAAAGSVGPAILAAGGTVVASMLVLLLARLESTRSMGPTLAIGVATMVVAGLTLLPALLATLGRRSFWPAIPQVGSGKPEPSRFWTRVGAAIAHRPWVCVVSVTFVLLLGALGNLTHTDALGFGEGFRKAPDSQKGNDLIRASFPAGETAPVDIVVSADRVTAATRAARSLPAVAAVRDTGASRSGELVHLEATLRSDPYGSQATEAIPKLRRAVRAAAGSGIAVVGGITAENYDTNQTTKRDTRVIVPSILLLIFLILILLLRALVAPAYLIATVILSFAFTLGVSLLIFKHVFGMDSTAEGLPLFVFIFLVALGVDYNIFLMSRVRQESVTLGIKGGVLEALAVTGGVITGAGVILAGTFSVLTILPLDGLVQIGFAIAFGVLIDTLLVRSVLVPAIALVAGRWNWWPSGRERPQGGGGRRPA